MSRIGYRVVDETRVGVYHIWSLAGRGIFLTGIDRHRLLTFKYREDWFRERLASLTRTLAVECRDWEVHPHHFRLIVCNRPDLVAEWSDAEIARRTLRLNRSTFELAPPPSDEAIAQWLAKPAQLERARARMASISWFMGSLKQPIARRGMDEDGGIGHFFEPKYGCEPLPLDAERLADIAPELIKPYVRAIAQRDPTRRPPRDILRGFW